MVRIGAFLVGLFFAGWLFISFLVGAVAYVSEPPQPTVEHEFHKPVKHVSFSFDGPLGKYDQAQLQRGFQVFKEVCSACHSLKFVAFRDLQALGYNEAEVKAIAKQWAIKTPSVDPATGEASSRDPVPADHFPLPFANNVAAAAANNNAIPPDLSLMTKARHHGSAYVYSLLTGFQAQPAELLKEFPDAKTPEGLHYNPYFPNLNLAMAPPLTADGQVTYGPGQPKPTVDQMAQDVSAFLTWTAEPKLENRRRAGLATLIFLLIATGLAYMSYQNIWADKKKAA
ncbi:MAG: cytochrome c1 [Pseudomonadota bacterium]|uniref:Cytochrome c1 n=1 Tax=Sphingobium xenophagum TaxID=121428 RepID=A0A249MQA7_SPHXE|nr:MULTISPECIES: cytochrome c1 [Sphingobium]ASY43531.1 cytochrome c1 [Sphingobium xenophagum]MBG6117747.1 ubiquinol-cytochrome c reductase cytochrome c1 subunit [Sphingobium sp. JAI105]OUC55501.1 cytochrome c1 [Sphingobium sp. GW456-12-10-14-TSB1]PSO12408.1 cytochrome c1 [Sphingobium sp. AEW4]QWT13340.1 cytochrome c1 [Sphingobium xenophagum]|tara:strand:- start:3404 stop:4255 length:852 start_codon:yes stop_codon:yes gene_type:complete